MLDSPRSLVIALNNRVLVGVNLILAPLPLKKPCPLGHVAASQFFHVPCLNLSKLEKWSKLSDPMWIGIKQYICDISSTFKYTKRRVEQQPPLKYRVNNITNIQKTVVQGENRNFNSKVSHHGGILSSHTQNTAPSIRNVQCPRASTLHLNQPIQFHDLIRKTMHVSF